MPLPLLVVKIKFALCAACHTASGKGSLSDETGALYHTGAPNLTDKDLVVRWRYENRD